jgi:APA family basic amino acid/polyamine antiporter
MGIFLTASEIAAVSSSPLSYLLFWVVGGLVAFAGAQSVAELATLHPVAGGDYVYLEKAYGPPVAFAWGWLSFVGAFCGSIATLAAGAAETFASSSYGAGLARTWIDLGFVQWTGAQVFAVALVLSVTAVNCRGLQLSARLQELLTWVPIAIFVAIAFALLGSEPPEASQPAGPIGLRNGLDGLGAAFSAVFFTYAGWNAVIYVAGEVKEPERTLPWSMGMGVLLVVVLYLGINVAFLEALSLNEMANTRNVGVLAVGRLFGSNGSDIFAGVIFLSILSSLNSTSLGGSRVWKTMAEDGHFWRKAAVVHPRTGTPVVSLLAQAAFSILLVLTGDFGFLLSFTGAAMMLLSCLTVGTVFIFRRRLGAVAPYKAFGYPWVPVLFIAALVAALAVGVAADSLPFLVGGVSLVALLILHAVLRLARPRPDGL